MSNVMRNGVRLGWALILVGPCAAHCGRSASQHSSDAFHPDAFVVAGTDAAASTATDASSRDSPATDTSLVADVVDASFPCTSHIEIASLADVPSFAATRWVNGCGDSYYGAQITPDLVAPAALVLDAYEIPLPLNCPTSCAPRVGFRLTQPIVGVTTDTPDLFVADRYLRASPGAVFRLRPVLECNQPMAIDPLPTVQVIPSCAQACASASLKCDLDQVCYPVGPPLCRNCEGKDAPSCACRTSTGVDSDGTKCQFLLGDLMNFGVCQGGYCFAN
jgi:hypothetical protein